LFLYLSDYQRYGNAVLRKKYPFPASVSDGCRLLTGWQNSFGGRSVFTVANYRLAFTTMTKKKLRREEVGRKTS